MKSTFDFSKWSMLLIVSAVGFLAISLFYVKQGIAWLPAITLGFTFSFLLVIANFILEQIIRNYQGKHPLSLSNVGILIAFTAVLSELMIQFSHAFFSLNSVMQPIWVSDFILRIAYAIGLLIFLFENWIEKNKRDEQVKTDQLLAIERKLKEAELEAIQQQLQPHFLFNALNSISALTQIEPNEAQRMLVLLSDFLRNSLRNQTNAICTIEKEIEQIKRYLEIEQIRFGKRLEIRWKIDELSLQESIPCYLLQPLVENAVKYGVYGKTGQTWIEIDFQVIGDNIQLRVSNPFDENLSQQGTGFGLRSVKTKMRLFYGQAEGIQIQQTENLFVITLEIPRKNTLE